MRNVHEVWKETLQSPEYWSELAKLDFAITLNEKMEKENTSKSKLAQKLSTSKAYISKILGGYTNFTIDTMSKLAHVFGFRLKIDWVKIEDTISSSPTLETCILTTQATSPAKIWKKDLTCNSASSRPMPIKQNIEKTEGSLQAA